MLLVPIHQFLQQDYWQAIGTGNTGIGEAYIYDATNIRLRNIALNYSFPSSYVEENYYSSS